MYPTGAWGPMEAQRWIWRDGREWLDKRPGE
jgi:glucose-6-phosphate 1-dehydrogenase